MVVRILGKDEVTGSIPVGSIFSAAFFHSATLLFFSILAADPCVLFVVIQPLLIWIDVASQPNERPPTGHKGNEDDDVDQQSPLKPLQRWSRADADAPGGRLCG